jgi:hypothetical protein
MTHKPAVPPGSTPPYPAHPAPHAESVQADLLPTDADNGRAGEPSPGPVSVLGAAVGIGSAAIVAALLYARRTRA